MDLGCGSGLWARWLVDAGYQAFGIDVSQPMIVTARARVPEARFRRASFLDVALPSCDAVTSLGERFGTNAWLPGMPLGIRGRPAFAGRLHAWSSDPTPGRSG